MALGVELAWLGACGSIAYWRRMIYDVIVVGDGLSGFACARELLEEHAIPQDKLLIVPARQPVPSDEVSITK